MAVMVLAHEEDLGVFSLSEVQWCQSPAAHARPHSRPSDTLGFGLAAVCSCCGIPQLCFPDSCSCLQLAVIPVSFQCRWQCFLQPFPHHPVSLRAKASSVLLFYVYEFPCRHFWFLFGVYVVCASAELKLIAAAGRKKAITYVMPMLRCPLQWDEIMLRITVI